MQHIFDAQRSLREALAINDIDRALVPYLTRFQTDVGRKCYPMSSCAGHCGLHVVETETRSDSGNNDPEFESSNYVTGHAPYLQFTCADARICDAWMQAFANHFDINSSQTEHIVGFEKTYHTHAFGAKGNLDDESWTTPIFVEEALKLCDTFWDVVYAATLAADETLPHLTKTITRDDFPSAMKDCSLPIHYADTKNANVSCRETDEGISRFATPMFDRDWWLEKQIQLLRSQT